MAIGEQRETIKSLKFLVEEGRIVEEIQGARVIAGVAHPLKISRVTMVSTKERR